MRHRRDQGGGDSRSEFVVMQRRGNVLGRYQDMRSNLYGICATIYFHGAVPSTTRMEFKESTRRDA